MTFVIVLSELNLLRSLKILLLTSICKISGQKEIICQVRKGSIVELRKNPYGSTSTKVPLSPFKGKNRQNTDIENWGRNFFVGLRPLPPPRIDNNMWVQTKGQQASTVTRASAAVLWSYARSLSITHNSCIQDHNLNNSAWSFGGFPKYVYNFHSVSSKLLYIFVL